MSPDVEEVEEKLEDTPYDAIEVLDEDSRRFVAWASVEVIDREGEVIPMSELRKIMPQIMERGGPIQDSHSNRNVGRILNYSFAEKEVDGEMKDGLLILAKIYDHTDLDDKVWYEMKEGERKGISFGGAADDAQLDVKFDGEDADILRKLEGYEFSTVYEPANQEANNVAVNPLAKAGSAKGVMKSLDLEYKGSDYIEKASDVLEVPERKLIDFCKSLDKGIVESVFGENVTPANVLRFLMGDVDLDKGDVADYQFDTESEAEDVAEQLGLEGTHEHTGEDGNPVYMPGESMEDLEERLRDLQGVVRAEYNYDSVSDCMSHKIDELDYDEGQAFAMCTNMVENAEDSDKLLSGDDENNTIRSDTMSENQDDGDSISSEKLLESLAEKHGVDTDEVAEAVKEWKEKDDAEKGVVEYLSEKFTEEKSDNNSEGSDKEDDYDEDEEEDDEDKEKQEDGEDDMDSEEMMEMLQEYIDSKLEGVEAGKEDDSEGGSEKESDGEDDTMDDEQFEKALNKAVNDELDLDSEIEKKLEEKLKTSETPRPGQSNNDATDVEKGQEDVEGQLISGLVRKEKKLTRQDKIKMEKARRAGNSSGLTTR